MNYTVMHKNDIIALADENCITQIIKKELCPACFSEGMPIRYWLENRCVDIHRSHSRKLFKALRIRSEADTEQLIEAGHGISITDNWWIKKETEQLDYASLKEYNEAIADIALCGSSDKDSDITKGYKELGTVGSYEKCWKYINGTWYMYKQGSTAELISEYYSYCFLKAMNAPVAEYSVHSGINQETGLGFSYMVSKDLTDNALYDLEMFCNYFSDRDEPEYIIPRLDRKLIKDYVMLLFYDVLLYNGDRHNQNAGVMRDSSTGGIIKLAPYFDYNLALVSAGIPRIDDEKGNLYANGFLENEVCRKILKDELPKKDDIISAVNFAETQTKKEFSKENFNYRLLKEYIVKTFEYISKNI